MEELDLKELLELFWSKIWQMMLIVIVFIGIGVGYTLGFVTPKYSSSTRFIVAGGGTSENGGETPTDTNSITTADITLNSKLVPTYNEIIKTNSVARQVISNLGIDVTEEDIIKNTSVTTKEDTEMVILTVTNENAVYAAKIANEMVKILAEQVNKIYKLNNLYVMDEAEVDSVPSNINHVKDVVIFAFIGAVIAVMYVLIANMLDTTVKTTEDVEKEFDVPVLATLPLIESFNVLKGGKNK